MDEAATPVEIYRQQITIYSQQLALLQKKRSRLGWLRLITGIVIISIIYYLFFNAAAIVWISAGVGIAFFLYIVSVDANNNAAISNVERLLSINREEVAIMEGDYYNRESGLEFLPNEHPYAADVDLFGRASLYQYINRCTSEQSRNLLASLLLSASEKEVIPQRQEAANKLSKHLQWRQQLQSSGLATPLTFATENKILLWLRSPTPFQQRAWQMLPNAFTVITISSFVIYLLDLIPSAAFTLLVFVYFLFAKFTSSKVLTTYLALSRIEPEVSTIEQQLRQVENMPVECSLLSAYQSTLAAGKAGSQSISELKQILQRFDYRLNVFVFIVLNTFLLWDVRQTNSLNSWKTKHADLVPQWFTILTNVEVLSTLGTLTFNHPQWGFPAVSDQHFTFSAIDLGHPLIRADKRVNNSISIAGTGKVCIITGSNMAGKSTFLRCLAVNLILAQSGAPVCAKSFTFSIVDLYSSMRIADNLAENTSTFYAELKKLKDIIDQVKQHRKIFILLDEILRGTNSFDRHTGSEALIRQLIKENAVAVIATHDVELAALKESRNAIDNYHFDVQVAGEELYFDYTLKRGICQSINASLLMKKIGIELELP